MSPAFPTKILIATGPSGGHIFPAMAFLDSLKQRFNDLEAVLILPERGLLKRIEGTDYKVSYIKMPSIKLNIGLKNISDIFNFISGSIKSISILFKFQPDIVVGFGSLASIPVVMSAWLLRIRTLIHEQNVIPGRANKLLALFSDRIAVSFKETKVYLRNSENKIVVTGNPLRKNLLRIDKTKALGFFGLNPDKFTILVMGGSQGSHSINKAFLKAVSLIPDKSCFQIIHLCGPADYEFLDKGYKELGIGFALHRFLGPMEYAYSASDIVLSRAGATAISEIIFFGIPAIFIPYPYAYKHQYKNAEILEKSGCAIIIEDKALNAHALKEDLVSLLKDSRKIENIHQAYKGFLNASNAGDLLVNAVMSLN